MDHATKGAKALAASDALTSVTAYTKALLEHPASPDYFIQRSTAFTRLRPPRYDLALVDADYAVLCAEKRQSREKIQAAQHRRVVALYGLGEYQNAKFILLSMEKWRTQEKKDKMEGDMWMAKVQRKLTDTQDQRRAAVTALEYPKGPLPSEATIKKWLKGQLKSDGTFNFDSKADSEQIPSTLNVSNSTTVSELPTNDSTTDTIQHGTAPVLSRIRNEWYQASETVTITLYAKGVSREAASFDIKEDSVFVEFPHPDYTSSTFTFSLDPLFGLIDPAASKTNVFSTKVELILRKQIPGRKWSALESSAPFHPEGGRLNQTVKAAVMSTLSNQPSATTISVPSYPTSSRTGPKDWDKLANDLHRQAKKKEGTGSGDDEMEDSDFESGDAVDGFFKKLYAGADDDTKRAMIKSFQESKGTALSTNWADVGSKTVEPVESKHDD